MAKEMDRSIVATMNDEESEQIKRNTYLFYIGIDEYAHLDPLKNAVKDAEAVAAKLTEHFDCQIPDFAQPLMNQEATRSSISSRFRNLARNFKKNEYRDNLIIYFAGHGIWDDDLETGYWALHQAKEDDSASYFSNSDLVTAIKAIKSHHTLIISDSCFAGSLIETSARRSNRKETMRSRYVLASGLKDETVSDGTDHSPFASSILTFLDEKRGKSFKVGELESHIEQEFKRKKLKQVPIFAPLSLSDNEHGELWLHPSYDVVAELDRLVKKGDLHQLESFIDSKSDLLRQNGKLSEGRQHLEELFWKNTKTKGDGHAFLDYLERFRRVRNNHSNEAIDSLRVWLKNQEEHWKEAQEDVADLEHQLEKAQKAKKAAAKGIAHRQKIEQDLKKAKEELSTVQSSLSAKTTEVEKLSQSILDLTSERDSWQQKAENPENQHAPSNSPKIQFGKPLPTFDFPVPEMVFVKGDIFLMGSLNGGDNEKPVHEVELSDYYIGKYPVTQREWNTIMGADNNPSEFKGDDLPVENVSWNDCQDFIRILNRKTEMNFRLPTEAEWEFAARGGVKSERFIYSGSNDLDEVGWFSGNSGTKTHPVGKKRANELGLYDMSGNVWEWCQDSYSAEYYEKLKQEGHATNPEGPDSGGGRVFRGGGWLYNPGYCRVSSRYGDVPEFRSYYQGFRLSLLQFSELR